MPRSVLGRTKWFENTVEKKIEKKTKIKCYCVIGFLKKINLKNIELGLWNVNPWFHFFYFVYFDMEINVLSDSTVWGPNFLSEHSKLSAQTSLYRYRAKLHTSHSTLLYISLHPPSLWVLSFPSRSWQLSGYTDPPSNPVTLNHLCIMDPFGILKAEMDPLSPDRNTHMHTSLLIWRVPSMEGKKCCWLRSAFLTFQLWKMAWKCSQF